MSTFPLTYPSRAVIRSYEPAYVSVTQGLDRDVRTRGAQRWLIEATYPGRSREDAEATRVFLVALQGQLTSFDLVLYPYSTPRGTTGSDTPAVKTTTAAGATSVPTKTWSNATLVLKAGDFIRFAGHDKVYMVTANATTNGSGEVALSIHPSLQEGVAADEALTVRDVPFQVALANDDSGWELGVGARYGPLSLSFVEAP